MRQLVDSMQFGRHTVTVGDKLRVLPSKPKKKDGFVGTFRGAVLGADGDPVEIDIAGAPDGHPVVVRSLFPSRVQWMRQGGES